jgi:hypothetical protein
MMTPAELEELRNDLRLLQVYDFSNSESNIALVYNSINNLINNTKREKEMFENVNMSKLQCYFPNLFNEALEKYKLESSKKL